MSNIDAKQKRELAALAAMPDSEIDYSDIPEGTDWSRAQVGKFYRPVKQQITLRLDMDTLEWFRSQGGKYQTQINHALRVYMEGHKGQVK